MQANKNSDVLVHIVGYCDEIVKTVNRLGDDFCIFSSDSIYKNAVSMCLLQIGELITHLTEDFKTTFPKIAWNEIKALRNVVAHNYGKIDEEVLWETIKKDIPVLRDYCAGILKQYMAMEEEAIYEDEEELQQGMKFK